MLIKPLVQARKHFKHARITDLHFPVVGILTTYNRRKGFKLRSVVYTILLIGTCNKCRSNWALRTFGNVFPTSQVCSYLGETFSKLELDANRIGGPRRPRYYQKGWVRVCVMIVAAGTVILYISYKRLIDNDKIVDSSKTHTQFKTRELKPCPS